MSHKRRIGLLLLVVLFAGSLATATDIERCVTYACTMQEEAVAAWDPVYPQRSKAEMLGLFILGAPFTALLSLAILRRRRSEA